MESYLKFYKKEQPNEEYVEITDVSEECGFLKYQNYKIKSPLKGNKIKYKIVGYCNYFELDFIGLVYKNKRIR